MPGSSLSDRALAVLRPAIVLLFALSVTLVLLLLHPVGDYFVETDFYGGYAPGARALWNTGFDPARYDVVGPVYEVVLALLGTSRLDLFRLAQFLSLAASAGAIGLASGWIARRFGRDAGWASALLMATNPTVFRYAHTASTDATFLLLATATFVMLFPAASGAPALRRLALAGLLAGLATLTRYTGIVLVPLGIAAVLALGSARRDRLRGAFAFLAGVTLVLGPWAAFTVARGAPPALRFYHNLAFEVYGRARGLTWDDYQYTLEKDFPTFGSVIARDPGAVASRIAENSWRHLAQAAGELWLWPLAGLAALGTLLWALGRRPGAGPLLAYGGVLYLALVPVFYADRYHLALVPVAAGLAAAAALGPAGWPRRLARRVPAWAPRALALACVLGAAGFAARATLLDVREVAAQVPRDLPAVGRALRQDWHGPGRARLIARKPNLSYYAQADPVPLEPVESLEALALSARRQRADYLFVSWPEAMFRPSLAFLLIPEFAPPGLRLVTAAPGGHFALYRIEPDFGARMPAWYPQEWEWRAGEGMTRIAPREARWWLAAGKSRHARRDYAGARAAFGYALRLRPGWGAAYGALGTLEASQGEFVAAQAAYESALAAGETTPVLYRNLGLVCMRTGNLARAEEMLVRYQDATHDPRFEPDLAAIRARRAAGAAHP